MLDINYRYGEQHSPVYNQGAMDFDLGQYLSTLIGAFIGALSAIGAQVVASYYQSKREKEQWERQEKSEREKREEEKKSADIQRVREIYRNSVRTLVAFADATEEDEKRPAIIQDAHEWLSLLSQHLAQHLNPKDFESFKSGFNDYILGSTTPDRHGIILFIEEVIDYFYKDPVLSPRPLEGVTNSSQVSGQGRLNIVVKTEFRREQFINGTIIPFDHAVDYAVTDISPSQRELLWRTYFSIQSNAIPLPDRLHIPKFISHEKKIRLHGESWAARLNPLTSTVPQIFDAWERDYNEALQKAQRDEENSKSAQAAPKRPGVK